LADGGFDALPPRVFNGLEILDDLDPVHPDGS
jgi:hypothetical protein